MTTAETYVTKNQQAPACDNGSQTSCHSSVLALKHCNISVSVLRVTKPSLMFQFSCSVVCQMSSVYVIADDC